MVSVSIISIGILGFFGAFSFISKTLHVSRTRTLATNLAQEKIESLKNLSYYSLLITTSSSVDNSFSPGLVYDNSNYPPENISIGGITFTRYTFVALAQINLDVISTVTFTYPDTGMKQITTYVKWTDGNTPRKWTLTNLLENPNVNPLDAGISGVIQDSLGNNMSGVQVKIDQNPTWSGTTATDGSFSFRVYHGSYTVRASSAGFYDGLSSLIDAEPGINATMTPSPLKLTAIGSGTVVGDAWFNPDIVISGVSVSSQQANQTNFQLQYIELFNPTTAPINIGGSPPALKVNYRASTGCTPYVDCSDNTLGVKLTYISTYVAPNQYYLIANTNTFTLNGASVVADAIYTDDANAACGTLPPAGNWNTTGAPPHVKKVMVDGHGGSVWLQRGSGPVVDAVGWIHNTNAPPFYNGTYLTITGNVANGFPVNEQIVRIASPTPSFSLSDTITYGRAYNSGNNAADFVYDPVITSVVVSPFDTASATEPVVAGVPAVGAVVASSDPYSGSITIPAAYISSGSLNLLYAPFNLTGVTTGTWQVTIATSGYYNQYSPVNVAQNISTAVPNGGTVPRWPAPGIYNAILSSAATAGFIKGTLYDVNNNPLSGITVASGGASKITGAAGGYFLTVGTGAVTVIANPNNLNSQYVQSQVLVNVGLGQVVTQNFLISKGGTFYGYLTSGTTPLPNYPVAASVSGNQMGSGTSDTSGIFYIKNLSTGTYTVAPVLDVGQDASPLSINATVVSTGAVWIGTFTVAGALGNITGSVNYNSASLTTGALLVASTASISGTPPTIAASTAAALYPIYAISSKADGSYTLPVRGNNTYYMNVYVPTLSGQTVNTTIKSYTGIYVTPGSNTPLNVNVP